MNPEELMIEKIKLILVEILLRLDPDWVVTYHWNEGLYEDIVWQDDLNYTYNEQLKVDLALEKVQLEAELVDLNQQKTDLENIAEPTQEEIDLLANVSDVLIPAKSQEIIDKQTEINVVPEITIVSKPTWEEVVAEYEIYEAERTAEREQRLAEEAEYAAMDIDLVIADLLGNDCMYNKAGKHWDDLEIRSGHTKPTWEEIKVHWAALSASLELEKQLSDLDKLMDTNIFIEAAGIFGTSKFESMVFFSQSWILKRDYASKYVDDGLVVFKQTVSFQIIGAPLDTESKVHTYHDELCQEILIAIDKYRDNEIRTYLAAKAAQES